MKKAIIALLAFATTSSNAQTLSDTINSLKDYSHNYLDLLFNKKNIDSAMSFWSKGLVQELKADYSNHKQRCDDDSTLKAFFTDDINLFSKKVTGKIEFFACDDKEGINIIYLPTLDEGYFFLINYDFFGDFESHNRLMRTFLNFQSSDKGKTWVLVQDNWIRNYMILNYYKKDYNGKQSKN